MASIKASYNYTREVSTHTFQWRIVKFSDFMQMDTSIKEYQTKKSSIDFRPQLKMLFLGINKELIQIHFLIPIRARISCKLKVQSIKPFTFANIQEVMVEPNLWTYLAHLHRNEISGETYMCRNNSTNYKTDFLLRIKFKFFNDSSTKKANLSSDLETLLNNSVFSDVIIKSNEGKEYKVHKAILAGRSAVLRAHFEHDTIENHTNVVEAPFETEVLDEVLSYIYSDTVPRISEMPGKVLAAADFYQLNGLKSLCAMEMRKQLSVENAVKTLELADWYHEDGLKQATIGYIKHVAGGLKRLDSWEDALSVQLMKSIYLDEKCSEGGVELVDFIS